MAMQTIGGTYEHGAINLNGDPPTGRCKPGLL